MCKYEKDVGYIDSSEIIPVNAENMNPIIMIFYLKCSFDSGFEQCSLDFVAICQNDASSIIEHMMRIKTEKWQ